MDETTTVEEPSLIEQEAAVIKLFTEAKITNPKKLKQMARRLYMSYPKQIQEGLLDRLINAGNPVGMLKHIADTLNGWYEIVPGFIASGYHGIIIREMSDGEKDPDGRFSGKEVHGFHIRTFNEKWLTENKKWDKEQELEIQRDVLKTWMESVGIVSFTGKVVCFDRYGFSGDAISYHIINGKDRIKETVPKRSDMGKWRKGLSK